MALRFLASITLAALLMRAFMHIQPRHARRAAFSFNSYFRAMNGDVELYESSVYPDTPAMQRAILRHQSPRDCSRARFLVFELWNHGLGSDYLGASAALAAAIASGRVLLLAEPAGRLRWLHAAGCAVSGPECFFQPVSSCRLSAVLAMNRTTASLNPDASFVAGDAAADVLLVRASRPWLLPVRRNLSATLGVAHARLGVAAPAAAARRDAPAGYERVRRWHTQASLYLLRLNARMQHVARAGLRGCAGGGEREEEEEMMERLARRTVGVPLRGSDKCRRDGRRGGEMHCVHPDEVVAALKRVRAAQPWVDAALVTSEDAALARQVAGMLRRGWMLRGNAGDVQQGSGAPWMYADGRRGFSGVNATQSMLVTLTCQVMPRYHVLTIRSNYHSLIDMLAKVVPGKAEHFSYSLGDLYYPI